MNTIIQGDCLRVLADLPADSVDLVFADPPYNLQLGGELWRPNLTKVDAVDDDWDQFAGFADYDAFTREWLQAVRRVMHADASIWVSGTYHNIFRVGAILQDLGFWLLNTVTWYKTNAMPNFNGTRLKNDVEFVIWAKHSEGGGYTFNYHKMKRYNGGKQLGSVWQIPACGGSERLRDANGDKLHSTQKPEALLERIIVAASQPGDLVLDPFSGTGTTAALARRLHRRFLAIESVPRYVQAARRRLAAVEPLPADDPLLAVREVPPRVPFRELLAAGYLQVGQTLTLDKPAVEATITADAKLHTPGFTGSIHQAGKHLKGTPSCNGWMHWFYEEDGQRYPIDRLRERYRAEVLS